ncbi:equilibrative nucleoside transporter 2-like [Neolamprologus brichardi]|uniref:equilibrative nucleoside transporter 2-like n=1 Tax=Neolamprologus brichardi TaxID=32507 RepID=UPI001643BBEF|nr:equilibrative nucleoside transporter 2-like [Neolamprologus brichardi]
MKRRTDAPQDRYYMVGLMFFILGLGTLLPWNFFMTASLYFQRRLDTTESSNGTEVVRKEYYFNNWMTLLSQLPLLLFTLLNSFLYPSLEISESTSNSPSAISVTNSSARRSLKQAGQTPPHRTETASLSRPPI